MASRIESQIQDVKNKGKGPALDAEAIQLSINDATSSETCVICLDRISEKAVALPCKHDQFDFPCLGTWIQQSQVCPLCKTEVRAIKYDVKQDEQGSKIFYLPAQEIPSRRPIQDISRRRARTQGCHPYSRGVEVGPRRAQREWGERSNTQNEEGHALAFRRRVYRENMYSAYVGTNRISRYSNITPRSFTVDAGLVNRAKTFIRRELQVFNFLNPSSQSANRGADRRAGNAEFLLEYIVGILKSIDLKGSTGQAEELLKDFLGREDAKLFLHELEAWLRSPYQRLGDWDRHVQYGNVIGVQQRG